VFSERAVQFAKRRPNQLGPLWPGTFLASASVRADVAPDVVVLCDPPLRQALIEAGRIWRARSKVPVRVFVAPLAQQAELARHGARADILAGIGAGQMAAAQRLGAIEPATRRIVGRDPLVLAIRGPERQPMALARGSNLDRLLGGGRLGLVDLAIGRAGAETRQALAQLGLWPALERCSFGAENTRALIALLVEGHVRVAAVYRSDIEGHQGISVAATFPTPAPFVVAAIAAHARSPHAGEFLDFLLGDGLKILERAGLEAP